jgi:hypothetical protein
MRNTAWDVPVFVAKGVKTSGHVSDLKPLEIGIFDSKTSSVATASGNGVEFFLAGGKPHTKDSIAKFYSGMLDPKKSAFFKGRDLISFEKAYPSKPQNEEWVIGYDGTASSVGLSFEKNKQYKMKVRLFGEAALKKYNREVERVIHLNTFVCSDGTYCDGNCVDKTIDYKKSTIAWVKKINEDVELQEFKIKAHPVFDDYSATVANTFKYQITVSDNGNADGLFAVRRAYPSLQIQRVGYLSGKSTYEVVNLVSAPASFAPTSDVLLAACGACPVGYTLVAGYDVWVVSRQLNTTTDLDDSASQIVFAASIVTAYSATAGTGVYLGVSEGVARVKFNIASGTVVVPASATADAVEKLAAQPATCTPGAVSAISWVQSGSGYTTTRTLKVTILDQDCSGAVIATTADVLASLSGVVSYVSGSVLDATGVDVCSKSFTISQKSNMMTDLCESPDVATYDALPTFKGVQWTEVIASGVANTTVKAGIRITAPYFSVKFGDSSYAPDEFVDSEPMQMELSIYDQSGAPCLFALNGLGKKTRQGKYRRLSGEFVAKQIIRGGAYFTYEQWQADPRLREVLDNNILPTTDRNKYYVAYYLRFKDSRDNINGGQVPLLFEPIIFVEEGLVSVQTALENALLSVTSKFNVELEKRG